MILADAYDMMMDHATQACVGIPLTYEDNPPTAALSGTVVWGRITIKFFGGGQQGFGDQKRHFTRSGLMSVEIFAPKGDGETQLHALGEQVLTSIEDRKSYPVWYRNIRAAGPVADGGYNKINIFADFEFDSNH